MVDKEVKIINWVKGTPDIDYKTVLTEVLQPLYDELGVGKKTTSSSGTGSTSSSGGTGSTSTSGGGYTVADRKKFLEEMKKIYTSENYADDSFTRRRKRIDAYRDAQYKAAEEQKKLNELLKEYNAIPDSDKDSSDAIEKIGEIAEEYEKLENAREKAQIAFNRRVDAFKNIGSEFRDIGDSVKSSVDEIQKLCDAWGKADQAAANYAKSVGMSAKGYAAVRDNTINNVVKSKIGIYYDTSADELLKLQETYSEKLGRNVGVNNEGQASLAAMNKMMGEGGMDMIAKFENFGMSMNDAASRSGKMFKTAGKYGLSFKEYSKNVLDNITIAQNYTFKNGIRGLESMARKTTAIKLDMKQIATFAEKVQTVEGAMEAASKLQVLGGSFSSLADPIGMLNEGLNDMEGLTDRVTSMIKGMGHFNRQTGEVEVSSFNKQRIRAAASAMGMDFNELMTSVNRGATREEIDRQLHVSGNGGLSEDMKELIRNTGVIENGKAGVNINGEFKTLDQLQGSDYEEMVKQGQSEGEDIKEICRTLRGWNDTMSGAKKQREAVQAKMTGWLAQPMKDITSKIGKSNGLLATLVTLQIASAGHKIVGNLFGSFGNLWQKVKLHEPGAIRNLIKTGLGFGKPVAGTPTPVTTSGGGGKGFFHAIKNFKGLRGLPTVGGFGGAIGTIAMSAASVAGGFLGGSLWLKARNKRIAEGKGRKGDAMDYVHTIGGNALKTAGIGMAIAGPIGAAIGAIPGLVWGVVRARKRQLEGNLESALKKSGVEVQGKYKKKELKAITGALASGKLDDKTKAKLFAQGDSAILEQIDKRRIKEGKIAGVEAKAAKSNGNEAVAESQKAKRERETKSDINLNINGTLKLEGDNGKSIDISKELIAALKDPTFINRTLIPTIMKGINNAQYGASVPSGINNYRLQPTV